MDKYAVDEGTPHPQQKKASLAHSCPRCGAEVTAHGNILICPSCGSDPFEYPEEKVDGEHTGPKGSVGSPGTSG